MKQRARAVVIRDGRLAVIRRVKNGRRYAVLPGGKMEPGETPEQTAVRELAEETSLRTQVDRLLWHDPAAGHHYFLMRPTSGRLRLGGPEVHRISKQNRYLPCWIEPSEFASVNLEPAELHSRLLPLIVASPVEVDVVGLPAAGWEAVARPERELVLGADVVLGASRQLSLLPPVAGQQRTEWPRPLRAGLPELIDEQAGRRVVAVASGDPLTAGIGTTLIDLLGPARVRIHPAVSSVALARARMRWPAETTEVIRVADPEAGEVIGRLSPGRRLVVLSRDADSPAAVARTLTAYGFGSSRLTVWGDLGTPAESRIHRRARDGLPTAPALNLVCCECVPDEPRATWSSVPGLPDEAFEHDGQLTKRLVRAAALAHLRPAPGELLWDLGAGAGSVAVEWSRAAPRARAVAVERDPTRAKRIATNAGRLGAAVEVVTGSLPDAVLGLPSPHAVFVGGGASPEVIEAGLRALRPGGRLVVHAVTVETESVVLAAQQAHGGEVSRIGVEQLSRLGSFHGWEPARAIVQWSVQLPWVPEPG